MLIRAHRWSPDKIIRSRTGLFLMSSNSQAYCRTASAVPWNHSLSVGVCVAARTSTKPSPPNRTPLPKLYVRAKWRLREVLLNCVSTYILLIPLLMQLLIGTSMSRYAPPIGTAGLARAFVRGYRRDPAPPPKMIAAQVTRKGEVYAESASSTPRTEVSWHIASVFSVF